MGREAQQAQPNYTVEKLVAVNPYNLDILPDLENYVNEQALMAMPSSDLSLCLFLIPKRVQMEEQFKQLIVLSHYLETGRFLQFWDEAAKCRHIVEAVPAAGRWKRAWSESDEDEPTQRLSESNPIRENSAKPQGSDKEDTDKHSVNADEED